MKVELTFGGYPVDFKVVNGEVYITCKGVTGTLTQVQAFLSDKQMRKQHKFGKSIIKPIRGKMVKIDCLRDKKRQMKALRDYAIKLKSNN